MWDSIFFKVGMGGCGDMKFHANLFSAALWRRRHLVSESRTAECMATPIEPVGRFALCCGVFQQLDENVATRKKKWRRKFSGNL